MKRMLGGARQMLTRSTLLCLASLAQGATPTPTAPTVHPRALTIDDLRLEVGVSFPALSPDGRRVAVVTSRPNYEENRIDSTLVLVDVATGVQRNLTPSRRRVSQPRWSPSGEHLAFIDKAEDEDPGQVYVLPLAGGEAWQVTHTEKAVEEVHWTPDGVSLLYTTAVVPKDREGEERHNRSFEVGDNSYLTREARSSIHLWQSPFVGGGAKRLTGGSEGVSDVVVSPAGHSIAFEVRAQPQTGAAVRVVLRTLDLASNDQRDLASDYAIGTSGYSPDGRLLAFFRPRGSEPLFHPDGIFLQPLEHGAPIDATGQLDRDVGGTAWLPDGKSLLVTAPELTQWALWQQPLDGPPLRLDLGGVNVYSGLVSAGDTVAFIGREPHRASELYAMQVGQWRPERLTNFNEVISAMRLGRVQTLRWAGPDGFEQNGVLLYPPDFQTDRRYPLVLNIHGGPMGTSTEAFDTFNQILAAQGWLVFSPNYRGSNSQGKAFQSAVINDAGDGPGRDVMSGVRAVKELGIVDERRIAVSGWSYGGFMTAWLTAHFDGWTVAVAGAAVTDWFDWYNLADMNTWAGFGLGGSPWLNENAGNYWRQSPMAYAHKIRAPTLILSNVGDERVTISQSYKLYHALKDNGVEVEFVAYPVSEHFSPDPVHQRDVRRRWVEWIASHFEQVEEN